MKNTKAIFLIILGAFIMATGFAFAGEALDQLKSGPFGNATSVELSPVTLPNPTLTGSAPANKEAPAVPAPTAVTGAGTTAPATPAVTPTPPPAPKPTLSEKIEKFVGENRRVIWGTLIFAFLGAALFANPLLGAVVGFALFKYF